MEDIPACNPIAMSPVLIVGAPRSGTSWVQRLLLSDPHVCGGQETHFFAVFGPVLFSYTQHLKLGRNVGLPSYWSAQQWQDEIRSLWLKTIDPILKSRTEATVLIEKTPDHAMVLPEILQLLPGAKVIHVVRDSRAVVASLLAASQGWGSGWAPTSAWAASVMWFRYTRAAMAAARQMDPSRYMLVRYEDLVNNGPVEAARLFKFIGIEKQPQDLAQLVEQQHFSKQKDDASPIPVVHGNSDEPAGFFRRGTVGGWREDLTFMQKLVVWRYTRKLMRSLGYNWSGPK